MSDEQIPGDLPDHVYGFALVHIAIRRDARRLAEAAPALQPVLLPRVRTWWRQVRAVIDWHHRSENEVLWPALRRRVRGFAADERVMRHDHIALDNAMKAISAALAPGGDRVALEQTVTWFDALVAEHLTLEEAVLFPIFRTGIGADEYLEIERRVLALARPNVMAFLLPWLFDGVGAEVAAKAAATIPPPLRLLGRTVLRRRYYHKLRWW